MDKLFYFLYAYSYRGKKLKFDEKESNSIQFFTHGLLLMFYFSACGNIQWEGMYFKGSLGIILDKFSTVRFIVLSRLLKILLKLITTQNLNFHSIKHLNGICTQVYDQIYARYRIITQLFDETKLGKNVSLPFKHTWK